VKFSAQEEYGLRCLLSIAKLNSATISEISRKEGLGEPHVAKILMLLRKGGFITSTRGQAGGYALSRTPREIAVGDVLAELGGKLYEQDFCERYTGQHEVCSRTGACSIADLWGEVQSAVDRVLERYTLEDLLRKERGVNVTLHETRQPIGDPA
jgi:Rrf2 family protein